jgi:hypothetical protein
LLLNNIFCKKLSVLGCAKQILSVQSKIKGNKIDLKLHISDISGSGIQWLDKSRRSKF